MLEIKQLTGGYPAQSSVIFDISFSVHPGEMVGLIGLNGAGKNTTIKQILGFLRPRSGQILFNGRSLEQDPTQFRKAVSYIPETPYLYTELTLREHLELTALAYNIDRSTFDSRTERLLDLFQMKKRLEWYLAHFPKACGKK